MEELPSSGVVGAVRARELLADVSGIQRRTRRPIGLWPPLVVFGVVAVAGAPLGLAGPLAVNLWWIAAAPAAFSLTGWFFARQARCRGFETRSRRLPALAMVSFGAGWAATFWLSAVVHLRNGLGWALAVAVGYLIWSWLARSIPAALVAVSLAVVGTVLAVSPVPVWTVQLGVGITMIIGGLVLRHGPEAR